ncbi:hypothetical protein G6F63_014929 [Rhizopus arrhizus]|nr:hypothetical protein G6F63_014929 [Rhizopus arrhizus]
MHPAAHPGSRAAPAVPRRQPGPGRPGGTGRPATAPARTPHAQDPVAAAPAGPGAGPCRLQAGAGTGPGQQPAAGAGTGTEHARTGRGAPGRTHHRRVPDPQDGGGGWQRVRPGRASWQVGGGEFLGDLVRAVPQGNAGAVGAACDAQQHRSGWAGL